MAKEPAVFLDRDGTIMEDSGYIKSPGEVLIFPYTFQALELIKDHFQIFIISNQSGIGKGILSVKEVEAVNSYLLEALNRRNIIVKDLYYCPHTSEDNCECKKPKPYFVNKAAETYNIDRERSFFIGDHPSDVQCGINAGISAVYLLSGHGEKHRSELSADIIIKENLLDAAEYITSVYKKTAI